MILSLLLLAGSAVADIRVLLRFDSSGHYVHRIIQLSSQQATDASKLAITSRIQPFLNPATQLSVSPIERARSWRNARVPEIRNRQKSSSARFTTLTWFDSTGTELVKTEVPDPRIIHSPLHVDDSNASLVGLIEGAWMVSGPESASSVIVSLAELPTLGLAAEFWNLDLTR